MTLPMDIRIAAKGAKIGFIFARRGLVPEAGSAWFLPKLVGLPQALRWCLSGRTFDADEAREGGLVSEVVEPAELLESRQGNRREMTEETSAVAVALTRQMLWRFSGAPAPFELLDIDKPMSIERGGHADVREGVQAFLEKRPPSFPGKVSRTCRASIPGGRSLRQSRPQNMPAINANDKDKGHPMRDQFSNTQQIRKPAVTSKGGIVAAQSRQGGGSRRRGAGGRRRLRRCRDRDHICAWRAGALDERARRRRRDGALPCARRPL